MYTSIKTDDIDAVQELIVKRLEAGDRLSIVASKDGDLFRFQINTTEGEDEPNS